MSGHSKWANIKHRKEAQDKKRGQVFTKLLRAIALAARTGGSDPERNAKLRLAIDRAKAFNVPKSSIERALKRDEGETLESFTFDAIGAGGAALIIEGTTDNRNRTVAELRHILEAHDGKMAQEGSARWAFARKGLVQVRAPVQEQSSEAFELELINAGAEDVTRSDETFEVVTAPERFDEVRQRLTNVGIEIADATLGWVPQQTVTPSPAEAAKLEQLLDALDNHPDVQAIWTNEA